MEFVRPHIPIMGRPSSPRDILSASDKDVSRDLSPVIQIFLSIAVVSAGIILGLSIVQWLLVVIVTLVFVVAGVFRTASRLQMRSQPGLEYFQVVRIKSMGDALLTITACISFFTYLLVFVPKITAYI